MRRPQEPHPAGAKPRGAGLNAELVRLYWDIGRLILARQQDGCGAGVIPRLARDLHKEFSEIKEFSEKNIKLMVQFYRCYPDAFQIGQPPVAQFKFALSQLSASRFECVANKSNESTYDGLFVFL